MAATHKGDRIAELIKDVEAVAKRLRSDVRKRAAASKLTKSLQDTASSLRKQAAEVAGHVEKYVHEIRTELEKGSKKTAPKRKKKVVAKKGTASSGL